MVVSGNLLLGASVMHASKHQALQSHAYPKRDDSHGVRAGLLLSIPDQADLRIFDMP